MREWRRGFFCLPPMYASRLLETSNFTLPTQRLCTMQKQHMPLILALYCWTQPRTIRTALR
jgi:hypothetical protein